MCAGMPAAAEGSYLSRKAFTNASASGTSTTNADSLNDIRLHILTTRLDLRALTRAWLNRALPPRSHIGLRRGPLELTQPRLAHARLVKGRLRSNCLRK